MSTSPTVTSASVTTLLPGLSVRLGEEYARLQDLFTVGRVALKQITDKFVQELYVGLSENGGDIPMNPTWVIALPTGKERGVFITFDMGGTNFRVSKVELLGSGRYCSTQVDTKIPDAVKSGTAQQLWLFIIDCLRKFLRHHPIPDHELRNIPLAFTFSYPVTQASVRDGVLQRWTKGFDISGVEGHNVPAELQRVLNENGLPLQLVAFVNDTTGTLMASSYVDQDIQIGSIFGTGSNAAYMEQCSEVPKLAKHCFPRGTCMAINCEYGAFDNSRSVLPFAEYDEIIDSCSPRPGQQRYEKLVAGLYLGEIFRLVLVDMSTERRLIFPNQDIFQLKQPYTLDSSFVARIGTDNSDDLHVSKCLFERVLSISASSEELYFCRLVAHLIGQRAARLYSCGIAAIMKKRSLGKCHVAVDGSVFNKYDGFRDKVMEALGEILDWPGNSQCDAVKLVPAVDGSSIGAAVICALTSRLSGSEPQ